MRLVRNAMQRERLRDRMTPFFLIKAGIVVLYAGIVVTAVGVLWGMVSE